MWAFGGIQTLHNDVMEWKRFTYKGSLANPAVTAHYKGPIMYSFDVFIAVSTLFQTVTLIVTGVMIDTGNSHHNLWFPSQRALDIGRVSMTWSSWDTGHCGMSPRSRSVRTDPWLSWINKNHSSLTYAYVKLCLNIDWYVLQYMLKGKISLDDIDIPYIFSINFEYLTFHVAWWSYCVCKLTGADVGYYLLGPRLLTWFNFYTNVNK